MEPVIGRAELQAVLRELAQVRRELDTLKRRSSSHLSLGEITDPGAAEADSVRVFAEDDGGGTTQLSARFPTGKVTIATPTGATDQATGRAYRTGDTLGTGAWTKLNFTSGSSLIDTAGSMVDLTNDQLDIPADGVYLVGGQLEIAYTGAYVGGVRIYHNAAGTDCYDLHYITGTYWGGTISMPMALSSGDYLELYGFQNSGATRSLGVKNMWAILLYPT